MDITYHLAVESKSGKNFLRIRVSHTTGATTPSEKQALALLGKHNYCVLADQAFDVLRLLAGTGRVFYQDKKVFIDPFTTYDLYFTAEKKSSDTAVFSPFFKHKKKQTPLNQCDIIFAADPSWCLHKGIISAFKEEISAKWIQAGANGSFLLEGQALTTFLDKAELEVAIIWQNAEAFAPMEPTPFLVLTDRHGGFAHLWFDYASFGKIAEHDPTKHSWRNFSSEKLWQKDLLETDFIPKRMENSHYYCPLNHVAKSLTFLLEIGWTILDQNGKKIVRQKKMTIDADLHSSQLILRGTVHYDEHQADLKDLIGAFNRQEQFVQLTNNTVALFDRTAFEQEWGDLVDQELTNDGIAIQKSQFGLLQPLLEKTLAENVRQKILQFTMPKTYPDLGKEFHGTLFSYQKEGLQWLQFLYEARLGGLLADEMGLGKTVQVLAFFSQLDWQRPCLIVVPTSLLFNWQREIQKFVPHIPTYRHEGKDRMRCPSELEKKSIILTSFAQLRIDASLLQSIHYQVVIVDEAQGIKNPDSQIAQVCFSLQADMRLAITGTPIENRMDDLWSLFHFLEPTLLGERAIFCAHTQTNLQRIKRKIRPFLLRRKKEQVALQLPPKLEQTVFVDMSEEERLIYDRYLKNTKQGLLKKVSLDGASPHRMAILEAILRLRQLCAHPLLLNEMNESAKFQRLITDIQEVIGENQKVLIYSQFTSMLKIIEKTVRQNGWKYVYLDGSTKNREQTVRQFQEDPSTQIFLISLKAGGVGLNLTAADYVFLYDPWWNEAVERQAIDRAHRLGKTGTVIARRYITALSIEEKILRLKEHKVALSQHLLEDEGEFSSVSLEDLLALLED